MLKSALFLLIIC